ncbi:hypothetical protein K431DRAFT_283439 [Polychaeton citri CBS 116435]|uniref:Uncharacterized protein n=1 Tax=Polychaeton citri CBS 116435 TaxID=1314669 RepID=A0A9P4QDZ0_9PEZI|nr:hypothetical protein K431DRAFT_283439 [Polychaeton citri CBS 116435]
MGGMSDAPYMYDGPSQQRIAYPYSHFNPRAVTQAEAEKAKRRSQQSEKPKQEGPLINFNQHPDSYMIIGGRQPDFKPLPPNTKKAITVVRWVQFAHRIINEISALGMLVCAILIKGMQGAERWLVTIPPAFDALITLYAIYHLVRPAKSRTPSSSASYHFFALIIDTGLVVFYVIIALFAHNNFIEVAGTDGRWTSFFDLETTNLIIEVTFFGAIEIGALHLICTGIDLYLIIVFRKIANLPPDMNPLEDNLTSRKSVRGHKYKDSNASALSGSTADVSLEKNRAYLSGSTLSVNNQSQVSVAKDGTEVRQMEFRHSRTNSDYAFSPHNPQSARLSRQQYDDAQAMYQQERSTRNSTRDFNGNRAGSLSPSKHNFDSSMEIPMPDMMRHNGSPRPGSFATARSHRSDSPSRYHNGNAKSMSSLNLPAPTNAAERHAMAKSSQKDGLLPKEGSNSNWYAFDDDDEDEHSDLGIPAPQRAQAQYADSPSTPAPIERNDSFEPMPSPIKPLGMHPPSPATKAKFSPPSKQQQQNERADSGFGSQPTYSAPRSRTTTMHTRADSGFMSHDSASSAGFTHQLAVAKMYQAQRFQREREAQQQSTPPKHDRHDSFEPASQTPTTPINVPNLPLLTRDPPTPTAPGIHEQTRLMRDITPEPEDDDEDDEHNDDYENHHHNSQQAHHYHDDEAEHHDGKLGVHRSNTSATASSSQYSESAPSLMTSISNPSHLAKGVSTPKGKYYGDLSAAMAAVRGGASPSGRGAYTKVAGKGSPYYNGNGDHDAPLPPRKNPARVVSRSGVDIADAMLYGPGAGPRRREVSGKVAEEGRGGRW